MAKGIRWTTSEEINREKRIFLTKILVSFILLGILVAVFLMKIG